jgi:hypothetical protein
MDMDYRCHQQHLVYGGSGGGDNGLVLFGNRHQNPLHNPNPNNNKENGDAFFFPGVLLHRQQQQQQQGVTGRRPKTNPRHMSTASIGGNGTHDGHDLGGASTAV